ncbi:hypothetical protein [Vreelandella sedimenti]|uniref:hypothetical protein n=1 Tax=Vreelandella sedimenti TaxID=2729618 RepID=UPI00257D6264|nr:hypothetical protein [Halomonas sp. UBA3173]|tara:strand:+ start:27687 stop:28568 length:882 start_codon:yes stop_codon:yes gene_type:complete
MNQANIPQNLKLIMIGSVAAILSGCSISPTYDQRFDPENHSRAYNLAQAGNLWKVQDRKVDQQDYTAAMANLSDAFGTTLLVNNDVALGLDWGTSLGIGLLDFLTSPPDQLKRDSAFFFVPTSQAPSSNEAQALVFDHYRLAVQQAAKELGLELQQHGDDNLHQASSNRQGVGFVLVDKNRGCPGYDTQVANANDRCRVILEITEKASHTSMAPLVTGLGENVHFYQASDHYRYSPFWVLLPDSAELNQEAITARISAHMPDWFYVYLAPDREAKRPAMVFERGEPHLFIMPQ